MDSREEKKTSGSGDKPVPVPAPVSKDSSPAQSLSPVDSSPARSLSPVTDDKSPLPPANSPPKSSVSSDLTHESSISHGSSPRQETTPASPPRKILPPVESPAAKPPSPPPPQPVVNRYVRDEPVVVTSKADPVADGDSIGRVVEGEIGGIGDAGTLRRVRRPKLSILRRVKRDTMVKKTALGFRALGFLFCLISFSVMAADRNRGWTLDSFERYKEFRYCMAVNVVGFVYSSFQACRLSYHFVTGKYVSRNQLRYYFDFTMDQVLAYLLISAASSAATRVDDWESNWGKDKFPAMASASVGMSYLAFVAMAASSLLSGYALCTSKST